MKGKIKSFLHPSNNRNLNLTEKYLPKFSYSDVENDLKIFIKPALVFLRNLRTTEYPINAVDPLLLSRTLDFKIELLKITN